MKLIKLNESQYKRLFEMDSFVKGAAGDDLSSLPNNIGNKEVNPAAGEMDGKDGEKTFAKPLGGIQPDENGELHKKDYGAVLSPNDRYGTFRNAR
jgi:hypothetical protein